MGCIRAVNGVFTPGGVVGVMAQPAGEHTVLVDRISQARLRPKNRVTLLQLQARDWRGM
jgi:hypothetical protein